MTKPTNPQEEQEKGRVAVWLDPDDIRWLAKLVAQQEPDENHQDSQEQLLRIRFRLLTALHKAGHDNKIWDEI